MIYGQEKGPARSSRPSQTLGFRSLLVGKGQHQWRRTGLNRSRGASFDLEPDRPLWRLSRSFLFLRGKPVRGSPNRLSCQRRWQPANSKPRLSICMQCTLVLRSIHRRASLLSAAFGVRCGVVRARAATREGLSLTSSWPSPPTAPTPTPPPTTPPTILAILPNNTNNTAVREATETIAW